MNELAKYNSSQIAKTVTENLPTDKILQSSLVPYDPLYAKSVIMEALRNCKGIEEIYQKDKNSIYSAIINGLSVGALPDNEMGYLVPFKGKLTFMPSYKLSYFLCEKAGIITPLSTKSGQIYEGEEWVFSQKTGLNYVHDFNRPRVIEVGQGNKAEKKLENPQFYYAVCQQSDGEWLFNQMTYDQAIVYRISLKIEREKQDTNVWYTNFDEMCQKTCIQRMLRKNFTRAKAILRQMPKEEILPEPVQNVEVVECQILQTGE